MIFSKFRDAPEGFWLMTATGIAVIGGSAALYYAYQNCGKKSLPTRWEEIGRVSRLLIHPLKSAGGVSTSEAKATFQGLSNGAIIDRSFIIYTEDGDMITGRQVGKLATLSTSVDGQKLTIATKDGKKISLDISKLDQNKEFKTFQIRSDNVEGIDCGDEVAEWLSDVLYSGSKRLRLFYKGGIKWRRGRRKMEFFNFPNFGKNDTTLYNDSTSYMIMTESSLNDLNTRLTRPVNFDYFRPCIVIDGTKPYDEDTWTYIKFGEDVVIHEAKPREVCLRIQIDPENGNLRKDHFEVLKSYRTVTFPESLSKKWKGSPILGVHCGIDKEGEIKVGDKVYVSRGKPYWVAAKTKT